MKEKDTEEQRQGRKQDLVMKSFKKSAHYPPATEDQRGNKKIGEYKSKHKHCSILVSAVSESFLLSAEAVASLSHICSQQRMRGP